MGNYFHRQPFSVLKFTFLWIALLFFCVSARVAPAQTFFVINTNSSGAGSLSQAVSDANSNPGSTIQFSNNLGTFTLAAELPLGQVTNLDGGTGNTIDGIGADPLFGIGAYGGAVTFNTLVLQGSTGGTGAMGGQGVASAANASVSVTTSGIISGGNGGQGNIGGTGGAGGSGVSLAFRSVNLVNTGAISGGNGGFGGAGGSEGLGGDGVFIECFYTTLTVSNSGTITGGNGSTGGDGIGIVTNALSFPTTLGGTILGGNGMLTGGNGVNFQGNVFALTLDGTITGGDGGLSGSGGNGALINGNNINMHNEGTVSGGSDPAGAGGDGINLQGNGVTMGNDGTITGGCGGTSGTGGIGFNFQGNGVTMSNEGTITGGSGGTSGTGGIGFNLQGNGVTISNAGTIVGGNGGISGAGGVGFAIVANQLAFTNTGTISGGNGATGGAGIAIASTASMLVNNGTISGGQGSPGGTYADAIDFVGNNNILELTSSSIIKGNVVVQNATSNNTLELGGTTDSTFETSLIGIQYQGFDTFVKTDSSTWSLTGTSSFAGQTTINAGTLAIGNTSALGTGNVTLNGGTLTTGLGNQVINIGGNYTQGANGILLLNVASRTSYDSLRLTGNGVANLNGTLALNFEGSFAPGAGASLSLVTTKNPVVGKFAIITTNLPSLGAILDYTNDVTVIYQKPFATLAGTAYTPNQLSVAIYLDAYDSISTNIAFGNLIGALNSVSVSPASLGAALDQLTPLKFASFTSSTSFNNASFYVQQLDGYLANHRGADGTFVGSDGSIDYSALAVNDPQIDPGLQSVRSRLLAWSPAPSLGLLSDSGNSVLGGADLKDSKDILAPGPTNLWNVFISGNVILAQDFSDASAGVAGANSTTGAMQVGVDYKITPHWLVGGTFAYGHTSATLDTIGSNAAVNTYSPGVYASYSDNGWYANGLASYGFTNYSQNRDVEIGAFNGAAHSSPHGNQIVGDLDGGYDFHRGPWTFGPTTGLQYVHLNVEGYSETGLPGADLTVGSNQADSLRSLLGGRLTYAVHDGGLIFTPHLSASWQHEYLNQSRGITSQFSDVGAGSFVVNTSNPSSNSALAELGLDAQVNNALTIFADYTVQAGQSNYFGQSVQAGFKIGF